MSRGLGNILYEIKKAKEFFRLFVAGEGLEPTTYGL